MTDTLSRRGRAIGISMGVIVFVLAILAGGSSTVTP